MATNLETLNAALETLNQTTSQEAELQRGMTTKLDAIGTLIADLVNTAGVPQAVIDKATQIQAQMADITSNMNAQAARLDQLAVDPRNPVPVPTPSV